MKRMGLSIRQALSHIPQVFPNDIQLVLIKMWANVRHKITKCSIPISRSRNCDEIFIYYGYDQKTTQAKKGSKNVSY